MPDLDFRPLLWLALAGVVFLIPAACAAVLALAVAPFALCRRTLTMIPDAAGVGVWIGVSIDLVCAAVWGLDRIGLI